MPRKLVQITQKSISGVERVQSSRPTGFMSVPLPSQNYQSIPDFTDSNTAPGIELVLTRYGSILGAIVIR